MRVRLFTLLATMLLAVAAWAQPSIDVQPSGQTGLCPNNVVTFSVTATPSDASYTLSFQWQYSENNGDSWSDFSDGSTETVLDANTGQTKSEISVTASTSNNNYLYRCVVTEDDGSGTLTNNTSTSNNALLQLETEAPTISSAPTDETVAADANCQYTLGDYTGQVTATDNCTADADLVITQSPAPNTLISGSTTVILTVKDEAGNEATTSFKVTVTDQTAPTISSAPTDETVAADANCQYTLGDYTGQVTATDNCTADADLVITQSPAPNTLISGSATVILTVKDEAGNEATTSFKVTVTDQTAPTISRSPIDGIVAADANCQYALGDSTGKVVATDNCTADADLVITQSPAPGSLLTKGTTTVTISVKDEAGNTATTSFDITVTDQTAPNVVAKQETYNLNMSGTSITLQAVDVYDATNSSDNCGTITDYYFKKTDGTHTTDATYTCSDVGTPQTLTLYAVDDAGNEGSVEVTVNIYDTGKPVVTTKSYTAELDEGGDVTVYVSDVLDNATDNCSVDKTYFIDGLGNEVQSLTFSCGNVGQQTITVYADDPSGNTGQADATVYVVDNIKPTATVTSSYDAILNGNSVTVNISDVTADLDDNCGTPQAYFDKNDDGSLVTSLSFDCASQGQAIDKVVYVEDNNGNISEYPITINVIDDEKPVLSTQGGTFYLDGNSVTVNASEIASATDNCGTPTVYILDDNNNLVSSLTYDCAQLGEQVVNVVAKDGAGNLSDPQEVTITIADNTAPSLSVTDKTVYLDETGSASIDVADIASASDNCTAVADIDIYFKDANGEKFYTYNFDCGTKGINTITVYADDGHNNVASQEVNITVEDNIDPTINASNYDAVLNGNSVVVNASDVASATDNCNDGAEVYFKDNDGNKVQTITFTCSELGTNDVTVYASDAAGNEVSTNVTVNVIDETAPVVEGLDISFDYTGTDVVVTPADLLNVVSDNCTAEGEINLYFEDADGNRVTSLSFACGQVGDNSVRLYAEDASGNVSYDDVTVTIVDKAAPVVNAVAAYTVYVDENGDASVTSDELVNSIDDCSSNIDVVLSQSEFTCDDIAAPVSIELVATDEFGNASTPVDIVITVLDTLAPVMQFAADTFRVQTTDEYYVVDGNEFDPVSVSDNCSADIDTVNSANNSATLDGVQLPVGDTTIYWTATDGSNNVYTDSIVVIVEKVEPTALNELSSNVKFYPVPVTDRLNIRIDNNYKEAQAQILDLTGKVLITKKLSGSVSEINLSGIDAGIYIVRLNVDGKVVVSRIIKK